MNAVSENWVKIGSLEDVPQLGARCIQAGDRTIAVFRTAEDEIFAIEDECPHNKGPLSQGIVHDGCVTCPLHNWVISLKTGEAQGADEGAVKTFRVKIGDDSAILLCANDVTPPTG